MKAVKRKVVPGELRSETMTLTSETTTTSDTTTANAPDCI